MRTFTFKLNLSESVIRLAMAVAAVRQLSPSLSLLHHMGIKVWPEANELFSGPAGGSPFCSQQSKEQQAS